MLDDLMDNPWLAVATFAIVAVLGVTIYAIVKDSQEWETFKAAHSCKVVAKVKGNTFNTVGTDFKGNVTVGIASTSDKTGWLCDDGVTYYR